MKEQSKQNKKSLLRHYFIKPVFILSFITFLAPCVVAQNICDPTYVGGDISITPDNAHNIREFIDLVNRQFSANILVGKSVGEVPLALNVSAPWTSILRAIMADNDLGIECFDNGAYSLVNLLSVINANAEALNRRRELLNQRELLDIQSIDIQRKNAPIMRDIIKLRTLNLAVNQPVNLAGQQRPEEDTIQALENAIRSILHADGDTRGEVKRLPEQNAFLIAATQAQLNDIRRLIDSADRPRLQIFIKAVIYTVDEERLRENGSRFAPVMGNVNQQNFLQPTGLANAANPNTVLGVMTTDTVTFLGLILEAQQHGVVKVLARPFGIVFDGDLYDSEAGSQIPIAQSTSENQLQFIEVSRILRVRPRVSESREGLVQDITLNVQLENNVIQRAYGKYKGLPSANRQSLQTVARAKDGQIVVLGGLSDPVSKVVSEVPGLANIPALGTIFKKKRRETLYCALVAQVIPLEH